MKDKTMLEVYLPVTRQRYDVWVSDGMQVKVCTDLLARLFEELSCGRYRASDGVTMCDYETGAIFNASKTVKGLGLRNGSRVLLV